MNTTRSPTACRPRGPRRPKAGRGRSRRAWRSRRRARAVWWRIRCRRRGSDRLSAVTKRTSWPRRWAAQARWIPAKVAAARDVGDTKPMRNADAHPSLAAPRSLSGRVVAAEDSAREMVERQRGREVVGLAAHVVGHAQRVDDRLLGALHHRLVERRRRRRRAGPRSGGSCPRSRAAPCSRSRSR